MAQFPRRLPFPGSNRVAARLILDRPSIRRIARSSSEVVLENLAKKFEKNSVLPLDRLTTASDNFININKINKGDLHFSSNIRVL